MQQHRRYDAFKKNMRRHQIILLFAGIILIFGCTGKVPDMTRPVVTLIGEDTMVVIQFSSDTFNDPGVTTSDVKTSYEFNSIHRRKAGAIEDWQYEVIQNLNKVTEINPERAAFMFDSIIADLEENNKMLVPGFLNAYAFARKQSKFGVETRTVIDGMTKKMIHKSVFDTMGLEVGK